MIFHTIRWPYNWQTPVGYFITLLTIIIQFNCNNILHTNCCLLFFGICKFLIAFTDDLRENLQVLDVEIRHLDGTTQSRYRLKHKFHQIISFHSEMKLVADRCSLTYSNILFALFYCGAALWCITLLEFNEVNRCC